MSLITRDLLGNHGSCTQLQLPELKRYMSPNTWVSSEQMHRPNYQTFQDLNKPPESGKPLNLLDDINLDLNLVSFSSSPPPYTLGKVKFALERAEKEYTNKRLKKTKADDEAYAAGCPICLLYVLISKTNPKCPRCNMTVPSHTTVKKPGIDLNIKI